MIKIKSLLKSKQFARATYLPYAKKVIGLELLFLVTCFLSLVTIVSAATPGTSGAQFLNVPVFARTAAIGDAYTGYADDAGVLDFNPAGLGNIYINEVWLSYLSYFDDTNLQSFYAAFPYRDFVIGVAGKYHSTQDTERDISGAEKGNFSDTDMMIMPAFAYRITPDLAVGASIKGISQQLKDEKSGDVASDIGVYYRFLLQRVSVGASILNIGRDVRFDSESDPLPLALRVGGSWDVVARMTLILDIVQPNDGSMRQCLGCEYRVSEPLALRAGWKVDNRKFSDYTGFTCGFGLRYEQYCLDYAFVPHSDLGISHYITMGMKFGTPLPLPKSKTLAPETEGEEGGENVQPNEGETPAPAEHAPEDSGDDSGN